MRQLSVLLAANVAVWLLYAVMWFFGLADGFVAAVALPAYAGGLAQYPWTPLTYMFAHASMFHLAANMVFLWFFGMVACRNGAGRTLPALYLAGGFAGAMLYLGCGDGVMMGASSAVMAVVTGAGCRFASLRPVAFGRIWPQTGRMAAAAVVITLVCADGWAVFAAHAGGAIAGCLLIRILPGIRSSVMTVSDSGAVGVDRESGEKGVVPDSILAKVRVSGFESLSADERRIMAGGAQDSDIIQVGNL